MSEPIYVLPLPGKHSTVYLLATEEADVQDIVDVGDPRKACEAARLAWPDGPIHALCDVAVDGVTSITEQDIPAWARRDRLAFALDEGQYPWLGDLSPSDAARELFYRGAAQLAALLRSEHAVEEVVVDVRGTFRNMSSMRTGNPAQSLACDVRIAIPARRPPDARLTIVDGDTTTGPFTVELADEPAALAPLFESVYGARSVPRIWRHDSGERFIFTHELVPLGAGLEALRAVIDGATTARAARARFYDLEMHVRG